MPIASSVPSLTEDIEDPRAQLAAGLRAERAGRIEAALDHYAAALERIAESDAAIRSEALRRLAVIHNLRGEAEVARDLAQRAYKIAMRASAKREGAEALNALAGFALESGDMTLSARYYGQARDLAAGTPELMQHIEHNLGILANIRGDCAQASAHFRVALVAAERIGDALQAAMALHNLGMICVDLGQYTEAEAYFERALLSSLALGQRHLEGLCRLNLAETHLLQGRGAIARGDAEAAVTIFEGLDSRRDKGAANRILGMIFRDSDRPALAESKLASAIQIARSTSCPLSEAEARRELGILYQRVGRRQEAFDQLEKAHSLFDSIEARRDQEDIRQRISALHTHGYHGPADRRRGPSVG